MHVAKRCFGLTNLIDARLRVPTKRRTPPLRGLARIGSRNGARHVVLIKLKSHALTRNPAVSGPVAGGHRQFGHQQRAQVVHASTPVFKQGGITPKSFVLRGGKWIGKQPGRTRREHRILAGNLCELKVLLSHSIVAAVPIRLDELRVAFGGMTVHQWSAQTQLGSTVGALLSRRLAFAPRPLPGRVKLRDAEDETRVRRNRVAGSLRVQRGRSNDSRCQPGADA